LYERVKATLEANLSEFETAAKQRCFSQPVAPTAEAPENAEAQASGSDAYSEEEEAAVDRELTELRTAIALVTTPYTHTHTHMHSLKPAPSHPKLSPNTKI
jgi:hypothetical protein